MGASAAVATYVAETFDRESCVRDAISRPVCPRDCALVLEVVGFSLCTLHHVSDPKGDVGLKNACAADALIFCSSYVSSRGYAPRQ